MRWRQAWDNVASLNRAEQVMADNKRIAITVKSGQKVVKPQGFTAIRDGIKQRANVQVEPIGRKPKWLRARLPGPSIIGLFQ